MKKKKKNGFTLIELLVAVVILGIITALTIPQISKLMNSNNKAKYEKYEDTVLSSAKLYTDAYNVDMFGNASSGCFDIQNRKMVDKELLTDIKVDNATCVDPTHQDTFVRVYKSGEHYRYQIHIRCKDKNNNILYENLNGIDKGQSICDGSRPDTDPPRMSLSLNGSTWTTGKDMTTTLKIQDDYGLQENLKIEYVWTTDPVNPTGFKQHVFSNKRYASQATINIDVPQNQNSDLYLVIKPVKVVDVNGNFQTNRLKSEVFKLDNTKPSCSLSVNGSKGSNDWYITNPTVSISKSDSRGEIRDYGITSSTSSSYNKKNSITQTDTKGITIYGYVRDKAGNTNKCQTSSFKVDTVPPTKPTSGTLGISGSNASASVGTASGSSDATSGVYQYRYLITNSSTTPSKTDGRFTTSRNFTRSCGTSYYGWVIAVDNAGNKSDVRAMGNGQDGPNVYGEWKNKCTVKCGGGTDTRENSCALITSGLTKNCNTQSCCSDYKNVYDSWKGCSVKCGGGTKTRKVTKISNLDGSNCGTWTDTATCNTQSCCSDYKNVYDSWGGCTAKCGGGTKKRKVTKISNIDGSNCGTWTDTADCNTQSCCSSTYDSVGNWGACSKSCGTGTQSRTITKYSNYNGQNCGSRSESQNCNTRTCCSSTNEKLTSDWGSCSASCGGGTQTRTFTKYSNYNGQNCGTRNESRSCNTQSCCQVRRYNEVGTYCVNASRYWYGDPYHWDTMQLCEYSDRTGCAPVNYNTCRNVGPNYGNYTYYVFC